MPGYMFDPDYTIAGRHYAYPLVQWPTVIAGAVAAIAVGFLLNVLGLAIGAAAFNPFRLEAQHEAISIGGGFYAIFAQLVALQLGAYIAARTARFPDHFGGFLTGFMVWALAVVVAIVLAALTAATATSSDTLAAGIGETVGELSDAAEGEGAAASDLAEAEEASDAVAALSWWTVGALGLGLAGAVAGGWLGANHPKWETRPRLDDSTPYRAAPPV